MSAEACPLGAQQMVHEQHIPDTCRVTCAARWDEAIADKEGTGKYDTYANEGDEEFGCEAPTEYSDASLVAIDTYTRQYVIVDQCEQHGTETGEQGYQFTCPSPLE
jgi:hypothetical protein